jgi:hypothetical protein
MPTIPHVSDEAISLAGFLLAHAAWSISDLSAGDLLCPLAAVERTGAREFMRFEAEDQSTAIKHAWETIDKLPGGYSAWAFVHEGFVQEDSRKVDALITHVSADAGGAPLVVVQRFAPFASGAFRLLGRPRVCVEGVTLQSEQAEGLLAILQRGIQAHEMVAPMWADWVHADA